MPPLTKDDSLEAAEVALRRGQFEHLSSETVSLIADHFFKGGYHQGARSGLGVAGTRERLRNGRGRWARGSGGWQGERAVLTRGGAPLSRARAMAMAEQMRALARRRLSEALQRSRQGRQERQARAAPDDITESAVSAGEDPRGTSSSTRSKRTTTQSIGKRSGEPVAKAGLLRRKRDNGRASSGGRPEPSTRKRMLEQLRGAERQKKKGRGDVANGQTDDGADSGDSEAGNSVDDSVPPCGLRKGKKAESRRVGRLQKGGVREDKENEGRGEEEKGEEGEVEEEEWGEGG